MAVKIALESFVAVLKRSNLVAADQLQSLLGAYQRQSGRTNDSRPFAEYLVQQKAITAWQAEKLLQGKHKGFFLGKYRLLSLVGKGGMSSVYLAEHVLMRRRCAIKVLPTRRLQNASYLARFHREAQAVASLDHRNIVRAYDVDHETDGELDIHFLVMEYVEGKGLLDLVLNAPQGRLPPVVAAEYIRQAALGLQHAHAAGLVHRDVKPGNLLVDLQGTVKVLDLGLARFFESGDENSLTMQHDERVLGTADYLAPEQAVDSHRVDSRADIYGLGCTLYLCLTGQPPFTQGSLAQRLLAHQTREPPTVESVQPDVPKALGDIVRKMMAKDPADRYQTAGEVAAALETWLKGMPKTDFDRSFAGLERLTPNPPQRRADGGGSSRHDTVQGGSRTDASATPLVERRRKTGTKGPRTPAAETRPAPEAPRPAGRTPPRSSPALRRNDQETTIGSPPVPPPGHQRAAAPSEAPQPPADVSEGPSSPAVDVAAQPIPDFTFGGATEGLIEGTDSGASEPMKLTDAIPADSALAFDLPEDDAAPIRRPAKKTGFTWQPLLTAIAERFVQQRQRTQVVWGAAGIAGAIVLLLLIWSMLPPSDDSRKAGTAPPPSPPQQPEPEVEKDLGPVLAVRKGGDFETIGSALDYVREHPQKFSGTPSWTITVAGDQVLREGIRIRSGGGENFPDGVLIQSEGSSPTVLRPDGSGPVIEINDVERLTLRGFALDGEGRNVVVRLQGFLVGTELADLEFRNIAVTGLAWDDVSGLSSGPLKLTRLRFIGAASDAVALRMGDVLQLRIDGCRFLGPLGTGIEFTSSVRNWDVSIRRCVFHDVQTGVRFSGVSQDLQRVEFVNNTLYRVQNGLMWNTMPQAGSAQLTVHHNLFSQVTNSEATVQNGFDPGRAAELLPAGSARNNWTDRAAAAAAEREEGFDLFAEGRRGVQTQSFASTDPASSGFLKPTAPSVAIELKSAAPGADPIVGAIAP